MKEYYLIPKHLYDIINNQSSKTKPNKSTQELNPGQIWQTRIPPPSLQNKVNLNKIQNYQNQENNNKNPNIYSQLSIRFPQKTLPLANQILRHFENTNDFKWDQYGDLFSPINNYNIVDIIDNIISHNNKIEDKYKETYKYIILSSNLPYHFINNDDIKTLLNPNKKRKRKNTIQTSKWKAY